MSREQRCGHRDRVARTLKAVMADEDGASSTGPSFAPAITAIVGDAVRNELRVRPLDEYRWSTGSASLAPRVEA
jgi:hypothetical protein